MLRTVERFVCIDMHPAVYISFIAINLCLVFLYREFVPAAKSMQHETVISAGDSTPEKLHDQRLNDIASTHMPGDRGELPSVMQAMIKPLSERVKAKEAVEVVVKSETENIEKSVKSTPKSSGAALAAVPPQSEKPRKKTKRLSRGLVPPPPPGVLVVPPPPDAPSIYAHMDRNSLLSAVPPPMVFDDSFSVTTSSRSHKGSVHSYGKRYGNDRSRTVHNGTCQQVIVSR
jgi:hypothetical protein